MNTLEIILLSVAIIFIAIIVLSAMKNKKQHPPTEEKKGEKPKTKKEKKEKGFGEIFGWIGVIIAVLLILWVGSKAISGVIDLFTPSKSSPVCSSEYSTPSQPKYQGKQMTLYRFSDYSGGRVRVYLSTKDGVWRDYPKGGKIALETDSGRLIGYDEPGIDKYWGYVPDGWYIWRPASPEAWGVEIWQ